MKLIVVLAACLLIALALCGTPQAQAQTPGVTPTVLLSDMMTATPAPSPTPTVWYWPTATRAPLPPGCDERVFNPVGRNGLYRVCTRLYFPITIKGAE